MPSRIPPSAAVVVPAYNAAATITRTLDSAIAAADACASLGLAIEVDIVVVDDCSTDATAAIVERYAARDRQVRLIRAPENGGPGAARNLGVARSTGNLLFFSTPTTSSIPTTSNSAPGRCSTTIRWGTCSLNFTSTCRSTPIGASRSTSRTRSISAFGGCGTT